MTGESRVKIPLLVLWVVAFGGAAMGQSSSIVGTLTDQGGAIVPKGVVTLTGMARGATQRRIQRTGPLSHAEPLIRNILVTSRSHRLQDISVWRMSSSPAVKFGSLES